MAIRRSVPLLCGLWLLAGCAHGDRPEKPPQLSEDQAIRVAAYAAFLVPPGPKDEPPVVNCLGYTNAPSQGPAEESDVLDEDPEVLKAFHAAPELVAPFSLCRRPSAWHKPLAVSGKVVQSVFKIEVESVERPGPDSAFVEVGVIAVQLLEPPGFFLGHGWRIWLTKVDGVWRVTRRDQGWAT